ncbi:hypothetical protein FGO68_gene2337 [Halteria grandinella]|uniref:Uncharacterized protein n=1 Tax=Halteria grandinella TaxID=5974 RepID=A0A8J8P5W7_HALGN|nr:hypothetical protein FGO68_gene2337 [Halteria grandinella]
MMKQGFFLQSTMGAQQEQLYPYNLTQILWLKQSKSQRPLKKEQNCSSHSQPQQVIGGRLLQPIHFLLWTHQVSSPQLDWLHQTILQSISSIHLAQSLRFLSLTSFQGKAQRVCICNSLTAI